MNGNQGRTTVAWGRRWLCAALAALAMLSCVSCSLRISATELSAGYRRSTEESGSVDEAFVAALSEFSFALFRGTNEEARKTEVLSPLSAALCLAMIANGAEGETKRQLEEAFGMSIGELNRGMYAFSQSLTSSKQCKLSIADSLWIRKTFADSVREDFLQRNADWCDAEVFSAPFDDSTVRDINTWCRRSTDGMIDKILEEIDVSTMMFLINAVLFDSEWQEKYRKEQIKPHLFTGEDGKATEVEMMFSEERTLLEGEQAVGFLRPYAGGQYGFVGLLPKEGEDLRSLIDSLDGAAWLSLWQSRSKETVSVGIPEFTRQTQLRLNEALSAMGISDMFVEGKADFSGISEEQLFCSSVNQKAVIEVTRHGTKAAAVTWGDMKEETIGISPKQVILDRPFLWMIVDCQTGLPLFVGAVTGF